MEPKTGLAKVLALPGEFEVAPVAVTGATEAMARIREMGSVGWLPTKFNSADGFSGDP